MYAKLTTEVELFTNDVLAGRVSVNGFAVYGHIRPVTGPKGILIGYHVFLEDHVASRTTELAEQEKDFAAGVRKASRALLDEVQRHTDSEVSQPLKDALGIG